MDYWYIIAQLRQQTPDLTQTIALILRNYHHERK